MNTTSFLPVEDTHKKMNKLPKLASKGFPFSEPFTSDQQWQTGNLQRPKREDQHMPFGLHFAQSLDPSTIGGMPEGAYYDPTVQVTVTSSSGTTGKYMKSRPSSVYLGT